jgi:hypothetical protein
MPVSCSQWLPLSMFLTAAVVGLLTYLGAIAPKVPRGTRASITIPAGAVRA